MVTAQLCVVWAFLVIFVATAAITLASLVGWVQMEQYFKRRLFFSLILEVVGIVLLFARDAALPRTGPSQLADLRGLLVGSEQGWDWQYANNCWRGNLAFVDAAGKVQMGGLFKDVCDPETPVVVRMASEPFDVASGSEKVEFKVQKDELGKPTKAMTMTLHTGTMLVGGARAADEQWGIVLTPGVPGWDRPRKTVPCVADKK